MKTIGIIFAQKEELDAFLSKIELLNKNRIQEVLFYEGSVGEIECVLVESGIGKVNAARTTQLLIDSYPVSTIFNVGVAGSIRKEVGIEEIVVGDKLIQYDFDITAFNHELGYIPEIGTYIESDRELVALAKRVPTPMKVHIGNIASADTFLTDPVKGEEIAQRFNAFCVEMEGAAIAQVCYLSKMPFLIIRSMSDSPMEGDNKKTYDELLETTSEMAANYLLGLIDFLK